MVQVIDGVVESAANADLTVVRVTSPVFDAGDVLDRDASTIDSETVPAIVSNVTEEDRKRVEGRIDTTSLKATVPSTTDIDNSRGDHNVKDRVEYDGRTFKVGHVETTEHPFVDEAKLTVYLSELGGR